MQMSMTGQTIRDQASTGSFNELSAYAQSSVEISRTAKGEVTYSVKVYAVDPDEAMGMAITKFEELQRHFYPPEPNLEGRLQKSLDAIRPCAQCGKRFFTPSATQAICAVCDPVGRSPENEAAEKGYGKIQL